jgi:hypothetical protein
LGGDRPKPGAADSAPPVLPSAPEVPVAKLTKEQLDRFTRLGAQVRLAELAAEMNALLTAFPALAKAKGRNAPGRVARAPKARKRYRMSPAKRKAAAERMRKYWAAKRQAKEGQAAQPAVAAQDRPVRKGRTRRKAARRPAAEAQ